MQAIFKAGIYPPYISAEAHSLDVFLALAQEGGYKAFKLVNGYFVPRDYAGFTIDAGAKYSFPFHSAGPFGNDIHGEWMTSENLFKLLAFAFAGLG